jgi:hypothetical protein
LWVKSVKEYGREEMGVEITGEGEWGGVGLFFSLPRSLPISSFSYPVPSSLILPISSGA